MSYNREALDTAPQLTFRAGHAADEDDHRVVARLAALDSAPVPAPPYVIAVVGERPVAARSLSTGETVADPFARTADILPLLRLRAGQLAKPAPVPRARGRWLRVLSRAT